MVTGTPALKCSGAIVMKTLSYSLSLLMDVPQKVDAISTHKRSEGCHNQSGIQEKMINNRVEVALQTSPALQDKFEQTEGIT